MDDIKVVRRAITVDEFIKMRQAVGWVYPEKEIISIGLNNTLFSVCVEKDKEIVGYGRIIGDGAFALYIQDIIVKPEYQRIGLGIGIMNEIMKYIKENYAKGTMVGLMSAKGKENFYKKFEFIERPNEVHGPGMIQYINK